MSNIIDEPLEDPKLTKKIVKRGITELVTPGVTYNENVLDITPLKNLAYRKALEIENSIKEVRLDVNVELAKANNQSMHDVVLSFIDELKPDLVLMMTHQESIHFDNYIGKFANEIIHRSESPGFNLIPRKETLIGNLFVSLILRRKAGRILIRNNILIYYGI